MVTVEGLNWIWQALPSRLADASLRVGDGTTMAEARLSRAPEYVGVLTGQPEPSEGGEPDESETVTLVRVSLQAEFGPDEANTDWSVTEVVVEGVVVDRTEGDSGRKVAGSTWTLQTYLDLYVDA